MKVGKLQRILNLFHPDMEIMILDGFNGSGVPREINVHPRIHRISNQDAESTADCEDKIGEHVAVVGFGSY